MTSYGCIRPRRTREWGGPEDALRGGMMGFASTQPILRNYVGCLALSLILRIAKQWIANSPMKTKPISEPMIEVFEVSASNVKKPSAKTDIEQHTINIPTGVTAAMA